MDDFSTHDHWKRMRFKRNKVYLAVDQNQNPIIRKGKVLIKYQIDQAHQYWVHPKSVHELDEAKADPPPSPEPAPSQAPTDPEAIAIYTDGACSGNPGPAGVGVVMVYKDHRKELSRFIGMGTNNIAELEAVRLALETVKNRDLPVVVHTDSRYVWGLLSKGWKAKENQAIVAKIRATMKHFSDLHFVKVKGHAGHPENERADRLAVAAIENRAKPD